MSKESRLLKFVEENKGDLVEFTRKLIQTPSINPPGNYSEMAKIMENAYKDLGLKTKVLTAPREKIESLGLTYPRPNVVGFTEGVNKKPVLCLETHQDVVSPDDHALWKFAPFAAEVSDNKIWGRGACDAKCHLASALFAAKAVMDTEKELQGSLMLAATLDDEIGAWPGMGFLMDEGLESVNFPLPDMVILGEPTGLKNLCGSFKGRVWYEISTRGKSAHGGTPHAGVNAIDKMFSLISEVKKLELKDHPLHGRETMNLGFMHGGTRINIVPSDCRAGFDVRIVPPYTTARVKKFFQERISYLKKADPEFQADGKFLDDRDAFEISEEHQLVRTILETANSLGLGTKYSGVLSSGDLFHAHRKGVKGVMIGAGSMEIIHKENEYVEIDELVNEAKLYTLAISKLLT
jgi:succinyl-diaminopimelate desuccinylase